MLGDDRGGRRLVPPQSISGHAIRDRLHLVRSDALELRQVCVSSIQPSFRHRDPTICGLGAAPDKPRGCGLSNFEEFSAYSDAEAVFGGVVCVAVIVAPRGILLVVHMANDRHRDHSDGCADDESRSYQLFHFTSIPSRLDSRQEAGSARLSTKAEVQDGKSVRNSAQPNCDLTTP